MKLCKDCKWVENPGEYARCTYPSAGSSGKYTGFPSKPTIDYCSIQREAGGLWTYMAPDGRCGKIGRWFEAK